MILIRRQKLVFFFPSDKGKKKKKLFNKSQELKTGNKNRLKGHNK